MVATIIIIVIVFLFIISISKKPKRKPSGAEDTECVDCKPLGIDADLKKLYVYIKGIKIKQNETMITTKKETGFTVKGFNTKGNEVELQPGELTWGKSCPVVKWKNKTGLENTVTCSYQGKPKRNVWVKYKNGVTFGWKIQFK